MTIVSNPVIQTINEGDNRAKSTFGIFIKYLFNVSS